MESVSSLIFHMNSQFFPYTRKFQKRCLNYNHYYATATSTAMVLNDITYGDLYRIENTKLFGNFIVTHKKTESFIDVLQKEGYDTLGVHYPAALGNEINPGHMYAQNNDLVNYSNYEKALSDVEKIIDSAVEKRGHFSIYFCNEVSHLCYTDDKKFHIKCPTQRWGYGYRTIDQTVKDLIECLKKKDLLKDTVIILYGDHGDDFYCHDYNGGYTHSIEPYANIIHTPFMIYDERIGNGEINDIICSLDVKQLVYNLLGINIQENKFIFDQYHSRREYVFSRNLFAGQTPEKINGYISNVRKSFGITTPEYSLILTNKGCRLYLNRIDPICNNSVLDYFILYGNKLNHICDIDFLYAHYKSFMGHGTVGEIQRNFKKLQKWMKDELSVLERETKIKNVIAPKSIKKIYYRKNMFRSFMKIKCLYYKKKIAVVTTVFSKKGRKGR